MIPTVRGLEKEYAGRIEFVRVNVLDEKNAGLMKRFGFSAAPEMYLVDRTGKVVRFWDSDVQEEDMRKALDAALGPGGG